MLHLYTLVQQYTTVPKKKATPSFQTLCSLKLFFSCTNISVNMQIRIFWGKLKHNNLQRYLKKLHILFFLVAEDTTHLCRQHQVCNFVKSTGRESPNLYLENSSSSCIKTLSPASAFTSAIFILCLRTSPLLWREQYAKQAHHIYKATAAIFLSLLVLRVCSAAHQNNPVQYGWLEVTCSHSFFQVYIFPWWNQVQTRKMTNCKTWLLFNIYWNLFFSLTHIHTSYNSYYGTLCFKLFIFMGISILNKSIDLNRFAVM